MTIQNKISAMKVKRSEMINEKSRLDVAIRKINLTIAKLETIKESVNNPTLADDLVKPFEDEK